MPLLEMFNGDLVAGNKMSGSTQVDTSSLTAKCDFVRFTVADIHGIPRGKTVPVRHAGRILRDGMGIYSGTVSNYSLCVWACVRGVCVDTNIHSSLSAWFNCCAALRHTNYNVLQVILANINFYVWCPTGSLFGPLLFILYTNDQLFVKKNKSILFADDTTTKYMLFSGPPCSK